LAGLGKRAGVSLLTRWRNAEEDGDAADNIGAKWKEHDTLVQLHSVATSLLR
jgi:hypothetical protein